MTFGDGKFYASAPNWCGDTNQTSRTYQGCVLQYNGSTLELENIIHVPYSEVYRSNMKLGQWGLSASAGKIFADERSSTSGGVSGSGSVWDFNSDGSLIKEAKI